MEQWHQPLRVLLRRAEAGCKHKDGQGGRAERGRSVHAFWVSKSKEGQEVTRQGILIRQGIDRFSPPGSGCHAPIVSMLPVSGLAQLVDIAAISP